MREQTKAFQLRNFGRGLAVGAVLLGWCRSEILWGLRQFPTSGFLLLLSPSRGLE